MVSNASQAMYAVWLYGNWYSVEYEQFSLMNTGIVYV